MLIDSYPRNAKPVWVAWLFVVALLLVGAMPASAQGDAGVRVDDRDDPARMESAIRAFDRYLEAVDAGQLEEAREQVLDPGSARGQRTVVEKLMGFIRARLVSQIENEGVVVRLRGDWALVVYQYDTTIRGQTTRVITTAWMLKSKGFWRQFIVAPTDRSFWEKRRADFEALQAWFDEHAREIAGRNHDVVVMPVSLGASG